MAYSQYNGWTNYATWRINLELFDGADWEDLLPEDITEAYEIGQYLKDYTDDLFEEEACRPDSLILGYARAFISDVNWTEIGKHAAEELARG